MYLNKATFFLIDKFNFNYMLLYVVSNIYYYFYGSENAVVK